MFQVYRFSAMCIFLQGAENIPQRREQGSCIRSALSTERTRPRCGGHHHRHFEGTIEPRRVTLRRANCHDAVMPSTARARPCATLSRLSRRAASTCPRKEEPESAICCRQNRRLAILALAWVAGSLSSMPMSAQPKPGISPSYVASIRPASGAGGGFRITPGLFRASNVTARFLIAIAYGLQPWQIIGGLGWLDTDRFDVEARLENDRDAKGDEGAMIKALLADRFRLVLHPDTGDASVYALEVGANGPDRLNLKPSEASEKRSMDFRAASLDGTAVPLGLFASLIATRLGRNVIDRTNLAGQYDIHLKWTPDAPISPPSGPAALPERIDSSGPSLFTAIQEQLGLRLRSSRGPSGFLVVDRMERPSAN